MSIRVVPDASRPCVFCAAPSVHTHILGQSLDVYSTEPRCRECRDRAANTTREAHLEAEITRLCELLVDAEAQTPKWRYRQVKKED